jgi:hypothetical protein
VEQRAEAMDEDMDMMLAKGDDTFIVYAASLLHGFAGKRETGNLNLGQGKHMST